MQKDSSKNKWIPIVILAAIAIILGILMLNQDSVDGTGHTEINEGMLEGSINSEGEEAENSELPASFTPSTITPASAINPSSAPPAQPPASKPAESTSCSPNVNVRKDEKLNGNVVSWAPCKSEDFQFYKLMRSITHSNPTYPSDTVVLSSSNKNVSNYVDKNIPWGSTYYYRMCVVERLQKVSCGNVASITN
jgi:hypothetical protein